MAKLTTVARARAVLLLWAILVALLLVWAPKPWGTETLLRMGNGFPLLLRQTIAFYAWIAGAIHFAALILLAASAEWWAGSEKTEWADAPSPTATRPTVRWMLIAAAGAVLCAAALAFPRLGQSLWGDEDYSLRLHIHGHFKRDVSRPGHEDGRPYFRELSWRDAVYGYRNTNNHFLYSIVGKASLEVWQTVTGKPRWAFDETVLRAAPYIVGLLSIPFWLLLLWRLHLRWAAIAVACILPLHPWFIRYISEARGYAFVLFFLPLSILLLLRCFERGQWRHWAGYGIAQFLLLYSWPGMALQVVATNLFALSILGARLYIRRDQLTTGVSQLARYVVVNLLTITALLPLVSPCYPQVEHYLKVTQLQLEMDERWFKDLAGLFFNGTRWPSFYATLEDPDQNPFYVTLSRIAEHNSGLVIPFLWTTFGLAALGLVQFVRRARYGLGIVLTFILPVVIFWAYGHVNGKYLFEWYFIYVLPVFVALIACGGWLIAEGVSHLAPPKVARPALVIASVAFWGTFVYFASFKIRVMLHSPTDPLRDSVLMVRPNLDPNDPRQLGLLTAHSHFGALCYDAHAYPVDTPFRDHPAYPGLTRMMRISDSLDIPLYVNIGFLEDARWTRTDLTDLLEDDKLFDPPTTVWAQEPQLVRRIFKYRGGFFPKSLPMDFGLPPGNG